MNRLLLVLIGITFVGCERPLELTEENLQGNWYYCDETDYIEIHVKGNEMIYFSTELFQHYSYTIKNDSVTTFDRYSGEKNGVMMIELNNNQSWRGTNNIIIEQINYRINDSIMSYHDYLYNYWDDDWSGRNEKLIKLLQEGYSQRQKKYNCNAK